MFPSPTGGPISPDSVLHMLHRVLKRAGLPRVRFHDLRHTFATLALQNGVDVKTVSGMLGHFCGGFHPGHLRPCDHGLPASGGQNDGQYPLWQSPALTAPRSRMGHGLGQIKTAKIIRPEKVMKTRENPSESMDSDGFMVAGDGFEPPTSGL